MPSSPKLPEEGAKSQSGSVKSKLEAHSLPPESTTQTTYELPWGSVKSFSAGLIDTRVQPGEFAAQTLFVDFVMTAEKRIQTALQDPPVSNRQIY